MTYYTLKKMKIVEEDYDEKRKNRISESSKSNSAKK